MPFINDSANNVYGNWSNGEAVFTTIIPAASIQQQYEENIPFNLYVQQSPIFDVLTPNSCFRPNSTAYFDASLIQYFVILNYMPKEL